MPKYQKTIPVEGKTAEELYQKIEQEVSGFLNKIPMMNKFELERNEAEKTVTISSKVFSGTLRCTDSSLDLTGSLSLIAMPFKSNLDEGIERWVAKTFSK